MAEAFLPSHTTLWHAVVRGRPSPLQQALWHDTPEEALRSLVDALGGPKAVGASLYPSKRLEDARRLILHWCDPERAEKPSLEELVELLRRGRQEGCHTLVAYFLREAGYADPQPIEPEDEKAALMREYIAAVAELQALSRRMERVEDDAAAGGLRRVR